MHQWQLGKTPGWDNLDLVEIDQPKPGPNEVLVRMRAASINFRDTLVATDENRFCSGRVPFSDGAGEVVSIGTNVKSWKIGDRVAGTFFSHWQSGRFSMRYHEAALGGSVDGVLRQYATFDEQSLVRIPSNYSFEAASTLPCAGLTAWYALMNRCCFQAGETVLILGTGGVSLWAMQIAIAAGGNTIVTSSSNEKLSRAKQLGAQHTINYLSNPSWEKEVHKLTNKQGVDHVIEVGGPKTIGQSLSSVAAGGNIALIGVLTGFDAPQTSLFPLLGKNASLHGIYVGCRDSFTKFITFLEVTNVQPAIDQIIPFERAPEAYRLMRSGEHFGKIVVSIP